MVNPDRCRFHCSVTLQLSWLEPLGPKLRVSWNPKGPTKTPVHGPPPLQTQIPTTHGIADIEDPQTASVVTVVPTDTDDTIVTPDATFTRTMITPSLPPGLNPQNCLKHCHCY